MDNSEILSSVVLDEEFENLIKEPSEVEMHRLKFSVRTAGYAQIRVWKDTVICDSGVYKICREFNIPCGLVQKEFENRNEALSYICVEELKRDDLTYEYKKYLIGKKYNVDQRSSNSLKTTKLSIAQRLGEEYMISAGAVQKYGLYADAIDHVFYLVPEVGKYLLEGLLKMSHENTVELSRFPKDELEIIVKLMKDSNGKRMTFTDIKQEIRWNSYTSIAKPRSRPKKEEEVEIKKMPAYDPDADLSSLALTIPSWVRALHRAINNTVIPETTTKGRNNLKEQLYALDDAVIEVIRALEV